MMEDLKRIEVLTAEIAREFQRLNARPGALVRWGEATEALALLNHVQSTATEMYLAWSQ